MDADDFEVVSNEERRRLHAVFGMPFGAKAKENFSVNYCA